MRCQIWRRGRRGRARCGGPHPDPAEGARDGLTTKIVALVDALGDLDRFVLLPGQRNSKTNIPCVFAMASSHQKLLLQLSAGFPTKQHLLEPEAGFAQKHVAQNGPPNLRPSVGAIFARLRSNRMPQLFPRCRIWLHLIGTRSKEADAGVVQGRIAQTDRCL